MTDKRKAEALVRVLEYLERDPNNIQVLQDFLAKQELHQMSGKESGRP